MEIVNQKIEALNKYGEKVPQIQKLAQQTGQKPGVIVLAVLVLLGLIILFTMGATILMAIITVVYPSIQSIKALETKDTGDDDKHWLTYWCVFGAFTLLDEFAGCLLEYIPFYFYVRLSFFLYLMAPQTQGAKTIYEKVLGPLLKQHKSKIEKFIGEIQGGASALAQEGMKQAKEQMSDPKNLAMAGQAYSQATEKMNEMNQ